MNNSTLPLVSIIIPIYNSELFLDSCIQSAINQTYSTIEIILVNDGSTDGSASIIAKYQELDARIVTIDKKNEGLPLARKSGLDVARGKYIQHLDSDDSLLVDAIEALVNKAESEEADIVVAPFMFCYPDKPESNCRSSFLDFGELSGLECLTKVLLGKVYWCVWGSFQKRSLFLEHPIEYVPHITYGEDAILMTQLFSYARKVVSMNKVILNYNRFPTSMSHQQSLTDKKYMEFRSFPVWMENYLTRRGLYGAFEKEFAFLRICNFFLGVSFRRLDFINEDMERIINDLKKYPSLKQMVNRRQKRILTTYQIANWLGNSYLKYYIKKGRL